MSKIKYEEKGPITRNMHVKYEKIKFLEIYIKIQGDKVNDVGVIWKGFIWWVCMPNMKSLSLIDQKLWPRLKFTRCPKIPFRWHKKLFSMFYICWWLYTKLLDTCVTERQDPDIDIPSIKSSLHHHALSIEIAYKMS